MPTVKKTLKGFSFPGTPQWTVPLQKFLKLLGPKTPTDFCSYWDLILISPFSLLCVAVDVQHATEFSESRMRCTRTLKDAEQAGCHIRAQLIKVCDLAD